MKKIVLMAVLFFVGVMACTNDKDEMLGPGPVVSPVVYNPAAMPYDSLSTYHFFNGSMADLDPVQGVLPFEPTTPLFSDYAHKSRFVWMPPGAQARYVDDHKPLDFDEGTILIKNFWYDNVQPGDLKQVIETRLLFKRNGVWEFANYVWNDAQTEATLDLSGSFKSLQWLDDNNQAHDVVYRVPSEAECFVCHKRNNLPEPIGPKPRNLNSTYQYADGAMNQLDKWVAAGYLENNLPATIEATAKWDDPSVDINDRVRAYVDMNCAHCHSDDKHCNYRPMRFAWEETSDPVNLGICVEPDEQINADLTHIVARGATERSVLFYRISATDETVRMPLLGRSVVHQEAVQLFGDWINGLSPPCN
ncbi:MAG: hypothetical protein ABI599_02265 [Flavobacteriales bacterium]